MSGQDYSSSVRATVTPEEAIEHISRVSDWWSNNFTGASGNYSDTFTIRWGDNFVDVTVATFHRAFRTGKSQKTESN